MNSQPNSHGFATTRNEVFRLLAEQGADDRILFRMSLISAIADRGFEPRPVPALGSEAEQP